MNLPIDKKNKHDRIPFIFQQWKIKICQNNQLSKTDDEVNSGDNKLTFFFQWMLGGIQLWNCLLVPQKKIHAKFCFCGIRKRFGSTKSKRPKAYILALFFLFLTYISFFILLLLLLFVCLGYFCLLFLRF